MEQNRSKLLQKGPGGGAAKTERTKRNKYKDIDNSEYIYLPFILESSGAFGEPALQLCSKLRKIWLTKCCSGNNSANYNRLLNPPQWNENIDPLWYRLIRKVGDFFSSKKRWAPPPFFFLPPIFRKWASAHFLPTFFFL